MSLDSKITTEGVAKRASDLAPRRRTVLRAGGLTALLSLTSCASDHDASSGEPSAVPADAAAGPVTNQWRWSAVPQPPSTPRWHAVTAWTGNEALFLGGSTAPACPSDSHTPCFNWQDLSEAHRDGMAYNPTAKRWRRTATAPQGVLDTAHAVIDQQVYILGEDALVVYDAEADDWTELPLPPGHPANSSPGYSLVAFDGKLVALAPGYATAPGETLPPELPDSIYDLAQGEGGQWLPLPDDPLDPMVFRNALATPYGLLLVASDVARSGPADPPPLVHAALLDAASSAWRRLPDSDQIFGGHWTWTGERALDATPGGDTGSDSSYGRLVPYSGALTLPAGTWTSIPQPPDPGSSSRGWPVEATAGARVATGGSIYDDIIQTWTTIPAPEKGRTAEEPGPAVWTSQGLLVLGSRAVPTIGEEAVTPNRNAWIYHPSR
ncbi:Kelch repeat-containing protein [Kineococcus sp. SYSU DK001]|uniref:hypothetical protein n=1 Tax=Kineococcus sp. SYSU DK001 TaxID=3383122 RepID=UPI003D7E6C5C